MTAWQCARPPSPFGCRLRLTASDRVARRSLLALVGFLLWLLTAPALHAQALYEWREADGTSVYSQWPPPAGSGTVVRKLELNQLTGPLRATASRVAVQSLPVAHAAHRAQSRADSRVALALAALQRSEYRLRVQQVPRPDKRQHLVDGHSRLTSVYFERIQALETAVGAARAELQAAYAARDALLP